MHFCSSLYANWNVPLYIASINLFFLPPAFPPPPLLSFLSLSLSHDCLLVYFILRFSFQLSGTSGNVDDTSSVIVNIVVFTVL